MASFGRFVSRVVGALLVVAAALAALAAWLGLAGRLSPVLDLLAHPAMLYALVAGAAALAALLLPVVFVRPTLVFSLAAVAASALILAPEYLHRTGPIARADAQDTIKVIQFNARRDNPQSQRIADWLMAQDADIITLTEVSHGLRDILLKAYGWSPAGEHGHLIIFTRAHYLRMDRPSIPATSDLTFVNATYPGLGGPHEIVTAHFSWPTKSTIARQEAGLKEVVASPSLSRDRMILTGDLNATPWSALVQRLDRDLGLIRRDRGVMSYPAQIGGRPWPLPFLAIDHIYAGRGWATVKVERGPSLGSDHYPVIVTLAPVSPR